MEFAKGKKEFLSFVVLILLLWWLMNNLTIFLLLHNLKYLIIALVSINVTAFALQQFEVNRILLSLSVTKKKVGNYCNCNSP